MVIQCSECQTRFKLADDKLKPGGIKVRCAKCKHVFTVEPAEPAVAPPSAAATPTEPSETSFAGLQDDDSSQEFSLGQQPGEPKESEADSFGLGEEEKKPAWDDFSFADLNAPSTETDQTAPASDSSFDDFGFGPTSPPEPDSASDQEDEFDVGATSLGESSDFGLDDNPSPEPGDDFDFGLNLSAGDESGKDQSAAFELEPPVASAGGGDFSFGDDDIDGFSEDKPAEESDDFDFAEPPKASTTREVFDFGPEDEALEFTDLKDSAAKASSWGDIDSDPFGDEFELQGKAEQDQSFDFSEMSFHEEPIEDHLGDDDFGSISLDQDSPPEPVKPSPAVAVPGPSAETGDRAARTAPPVPVAAPVRRGPLSRLVIFVLGLFLTLVGAAGYFLWQSGGIAPLLDRINGTPAQVAPAQVRLTGLNGYFVNNKDAGQLFVIQGQAINEYPEIRSAITVKGALYDKGGKLLVQQTVFCGNRLDDTALQELPFARISEAMNNQFGDSLSNLNVAPGKALPFTIVFRNFPPELAEFTVESVDSRPGSN